MTGVHVKRRRIVVAFGGNALVRRGEDGTQRTQIHHAEGLARSLARILKKGHDLVLVHGNGPQVGNLLVQIEEAITKVPPVSLDLCVAQTEGSIGYMLERTLRNEMLAQGIDREVVCLLTQVVVDPRDPGLRNPTKPVGPFYTPYRAAWLKKVRHWHVVEDSGRGYRKVVASPRPIKVLNMAVIRMLLEHGHVVIAGGGGGVPVVEDPSGKLKGIEAVIDKDLTAAMIARDLHADLLVVLTDVDNVCLNYGRKNQQSLARLTLKEAERHLRRGQFPPGSMGPKIEAAVMFTRSTGHDVIITSLRRCVSALWAEAAPASTREGPRMNSLKGRDLLTIRDLTIPEVAGLLQLAADIKKNPGAYKKALDGKTLAMIFQKPSLRTRVTFETGMTQLHGHAIYMSPSEVGLGQRESVADVARNLERWVDGIMARVFGHKLVEELAASARIPVINGLSDDFHPVQGLSDLLTIKERVGSFKGTKLAYVGDGNNVTHSLMIAAARTGLAMSVATPPGYAPRADVVAWATEAGRETGATLDISNDVARAVKGAHFIYTDVWASMGQESEAEARKKIFAPYQVNEKVMSMAGTEPYFLHCLPAHRGDEVTDAVADSPRSLIFDQAENRLHMQKALLVSMMGE